MREIVQRGDDDKELVVILALNINDAMGKYHSIMAEDPESLKGKTVKVATAHTPHTFEGLRVTEVVYAGAMERIVACIDVLDRTLARNAR